MPSEGLPKPLEEGGARSSGLFTEGREGGAEHDGQTSGPAYGPVTNDGPLGDIHMSWLGLLSKECHLSSSDTQTPVLPLGGLLSPCVAPEDGSQIQRPHRGFVSVGHNQQHKENIAICHGVTRMLRSPADNEASPSRVCGDGVWGASRPAAHVANEGFRAACRSVPRLRAAPRKGSRESRTTDPGQDLRRPGLTGCH
ncbi:hypothetical protein GN956_G19328 [Arapaima gigas]